MNCLLNKEALQLRHERDSLFRFPFTANLPSCGEGSVRALTSSTSSLSQSFPISCQPDAISNESKYMDTRLKPQIPSYSTALCPLALSASLRCPWWGLIRAAHLRRILTQNVGREYYTLPCASSGGCKVIRCLGSLAALEEPSQLRTSWECRTKAGNGDTRSRNRDVRRTHLIPPRPTEKRT